MYASCSNACALRPLSEWEGCCFSADAFLEPRANPPPTLHALKSDVVENRLNADTWCALDPGSHISICYFRNRVMAGHAAAQTDYMSQTPRKWDVAVSHDSEGKPLCQLQRGASRHWLCPPPCVFAPFPLSGTQAWRRSSFNHPRTKAEHKMERFCGPENPYLKHLLFLRSSEWAC